ncbi:hypothetical protein RRG08_029814 [Elysia crispata]|uniref:Uncharacterized protein n=1 Tax=Elysia crispata TaxID=231223 RepID=A0AAE0YN37_9GAST|nr:hypothetical protein RRG08_029814 [Elysia crispata]
MNPTVTDVHTIITAMNPTVTDVHTIITAMNPTVTDVHTIITARNPTITNQIFVQGIDFLEHPLCHPGKFKFFFQISAGEKRLLGAVRFFRHC